jgi:hypothetical protein
MPVGSPMMTPTPKFPELLVVEVVGVNVDFEVEVVFDSSAQLDHPITVTKLATIKFLRMHFIWK